ncbi:MULTISPECIES: phosphoribosyltransferase [Nonomuraea]|uniref:Phosphoribosyltransferase family protein n=1 Tax=Nonomuraea ferruginea TaxID=46174 RepID=A0ABT4TDM9_9ACTN|nr:phosphoribosyltransferase family protein [Nonomuraea ferruginea]MDA0647344.1 phosphoribosyltransferase family protein [Nonomuraea ferruginea]
MECVFVDRAQAGERLAERLAGIPGPVVLALPRGGVEVAEPIVRRLGGVLDVLVTRKIGYPPSPEFGVGAIAEGGEPVFDLPLLHRLGLTPEDLAGEVAAERRELARRVAVYRGDRPLPRLAGREVVVADDGLATGVTARAALRAVAAAGPGRVTLAVPVGARDTVSAMREEADEVVVLCVPADFRAVGQWYEHFGQLSDADVLEVLARNPAPG